MLVAAGLTDINVALVVWTTVTFALLIVVLGKFAWGPILQMIETREKTIADALESAKRERAEAEKAAVEMRAALEKARAEAAEMRSQVVDLAIEAAGRLLATQMDEKKQRQLIEEYLEKLPKEARV